MPPDPILRPMRYLPPRTLPVSSPGVAPSSQALHEATERIMAAVTALVEDIRGEQAPPVRVDPREGGRAGTGNAHVQYQLDGKRRAPGRKEGR